MYFNPRERYYLPREAPQWLRGAKYRPPQTELKRASYHRRAEWLTMIFGFLLAVSFIGFVFTVLTLLPHGVWK